MLIENGTEVILIYLVLGFRSGVEHRARSPSLSYLNITSQDNTTVHMKASH